jgi:uncharacterized GH25 family protein
MPFNVRSHRARGIAIAASIVASVAFVSTAAAHDFWLVPHLFAFSSDSLVVNGKSGTRFPEGSPVQPTRVADAWLINAAGRTKLTDFAVVDGALRLSGTPAAGQYRVAVALTPRATRTTPAGLLRFLRMEGGSAAADRLERENTMAGHDTVSYSGASYAATVVQVGRGGARGFSTAAGFPLEFIPLNDPTGLHVGDTLHVRILGGGQPAAHIGLDATPADSSGRTASGEPANPWTALQADANGVAHVPVTKAGPWLLRSAWVGRRAGAAVNEFEVARSTFVFGVMGHH